MVLTPEVFLIIVASLFGFVLILNIALTILTVINIANKGVKSLNRAWWIIICIFTMALGCLLYFCLGAPAVKKPEVTEEAEPEGVTA